MRGAINPEEQAEMALNANGAVIAYTQCQSAFITLCQETGRHLGERLKLGIFESVARHTNFLPAAIDKALPPP